jgi:hypothetical protein
MARMNDLERFLAGYIACAIWSSNDEKTDGGGEPLDKNYSREDLSTSTHAAILQDCIRFVGDNAKAIEAGGDGYLGRQAGNDFSESRWNAYEQAGHDFWLTRNGHGCGFNDGDWPEPQASELDAASREFDEFHLYVGDDERIYHV